MKIGPIELTEWGPTALVALFVILIFLGVWVPGREARRWQRAAERSADQVDALIESVEPMVKFIKAAKERVEQEQARQTADKGGAP